MTTTDAKVDAELLDQFESAVVRVQTRRTKANTLPVRRCGRPKPHRPHGPFLTSPTSDIDWQCPGHRGTRPIWDIANDQPWMLDLGIGGLRHTLGVAAA